MSDPIPGELLVPDPDLMGSPEGDTKGLAELQKAARDRVAALKGRTGLSEYERGLHDAWLAVHGHRLDATAGVVDSLYAGVELAKAAIEALGDPERIRGY